MLPVRHHGPAPPGSSIAQAARWRSCWRRCRRYCSAAVMHGSHSTATAASMPMAARRIPPAALPDSRPAQRRRFRSAALIAPIAPARRCCSRPSPAASSLPSMPGSALPLRDARGMLRSEAACDQLVVDAAERVIATGGNVLLQVMDGSKLGWRLPSDQCVLDLQARWPGRVQVVVDACQMRLSRTRLAAYLERGYLVLVTGSKFFGGPAFSGAMLVPAAIAKKLDGGAVTLPQLRHYCRRSDWPRRWPSLRAQFLTRPNFGQWLRWEAALEEIRAYYAVPTEFRRTALAALGEAIAGLI